MSMLRLISSSSIPRSDAGYRAEGACVSVLFACSAIALKNGQGTDVPSILSDTADSWGMFCWDHSQSLALEGVLSRKILVSFPWRMHITASMIVQDLSLGVEVLESG